MNEDTKRILEGKLPRRDKREKQESWTKKVKEHQAREQQVEKWMEEANKDPEVMKKWELATKKFQDSFDNGFIDLSIYQNNDRSNQR